MKRLVKFKKRVRAAGPYAAGLLLFALLFWTRLGSLTHDKLSPTEAAAIADSQSLGTVAHTPLFLPINLVRWLIGAVLPHSAATLRLSSTLFALMAIVGLAYALRRWYGQRTAIFGITLFASSAWVLHMGRLADYDIAYLWALPMLVMAHVTLHEKPTSSRRLALWLTVQIAVLYIPGMVWFVILNTFWQRRTLREAFRVFRRPLAATSLVLLGLIGLIPFVWGVLKNPTETYLLTWLGLPVHMPGLHDIIGRLGYSILFIIVRTPADPAHWLGHLPLLGALAAVCFVAGCLFYAKHLHADRTKLLLSNYLLGAILVALGGAVTRSVIVPIIYTVAAGGVAYLLHPWLRLFPRNILARHVGISLVCVAIGLACIYNLRHYFVAWPLSPDTTAAFTTPVLKQ